MGTKFQCAINPLAENRKNISFSVGGLDDWDYFKGQKRDRQKSTVFINFEDSMDKLLEKENLEFVKRTMMSQENIFKQQVRELHRLYNKQKILMDDETRRNEFKLKASNFNPIKNETKAHHCEHIIEENIPMTNGFDLKRYVTTEKDQLTAQSSQIPRLSTWRGPDVSATIRVVDEDDQRLTQRMHKPSMYTSMLKNSSTTCSKDGDGYEECDVDLTLGIGSKKQQSKTEGSSGSSSNHEQSNVPHWLHQSLGSNKTC